MTAWIVVGGTHSTALNEPGTAKYTYTLANGSSDLLSLSAFPAGNLNSLDIDVLVRDSSDATGGWIGVRFDLYDGAVLRAWAQLQVAPTATPVTYPVSIDLTGLTEADFSDPRVDLVAIGNLWGVGDAMIALAHLGMEVDYAAASTSIRTDEIWAPIPESRIVQAAVPNVETIQAPIPAERVVQAAIPEGLEVWSPIDATRIE